MQKEAIEMLQIWKVIFSSELFQDNIPSTNHKLLVTMVAEEVNYKYINYTNDIAENFSDH